MSDEVLKDYIRWRGDLPFSVVPLNELDSAVLCELCYVDLSRVLEPMSGNGITFRDAYRKIVAKDCYRLLNAIGGQQDFVEAAAGSKRFGELVVTYYSDVFDAETIQFSAMHFELSPTTSFIAFRGTDNSIIGWKEDFMMSFTHIPSQDKAVEYLKTTMVKNRDYYLGGHSKGGNLAVYASSLLDEEMKRHILQIYSFDAPGFAADVFDLKTIASMDHLLVCFTPHYGLIGNLFARDVKDKRIVLSVQNNILQHDLVSWKVKGPRFLYTSALDPRAVIIIDTFKEMMKDLTRDERKNFVSELFDAMESGGAETIDQLLKSSVLIEFLKNLSSDGSQTKEVARDFSRTALNRSKKQWEEAMEKIRRDGIHLSREKKD